LPRRDEGVRRDKLECAAGRARAPEGDVSEPPFGVPEMVAVVRGRRSGLDIGCGSGRLTVALSRAGLAMTGLDTSHGRLADARERSTTAGLAVDWRHADMDEPLPFPDGVFEAVVSRLALMIAVDPVATLGEAARVLVPGGTVATAVWAQTAENPWFAEPRAAIADALGAESARFARAFGRLGDPQELAGVHLAAGLRDVEATPIDGVMRAAGSAEHWSALVESIGHFRRVDESLDERDAARLQEALAARLAPYRRGGELAFPRRMVIVTARTAG
jgi:ubiquinone/menaquinone biosynthesis C-methylase UbiE